LQAAVALCNNDPQKGSTCGTPFEDSGQATPTWASFSSQQHSPAAGLARVNVAGLPATKSLCHLANSKAILAGFPNFFAIKRLETGPMLPSPVLLGIVPREKKPPPRRQAKPGRV